MDKVRIYNEVFDICYFGRGGFTFEEVYNFPVWLRHYYIKRINDKHKEEEAQYASAKNNSNDSGKVNVDPNQFFRNATNFANQNMPRVK